MHGRTTVEQHLVVVVGAGHLHQTLQPSRGGSHRAALRRRHDGVALPYTTVVGAWTRAICSACG